MKKQHFTQQLIIMGFLIAMEIILSRFLSINLPIARIGFGFVPAILLAIMFGPFWAAFCCGIADILGALLVPTGPFFPGFTLTAALGGLVYGLILYKKPITSKRIFFASICVLIPFSLVLNTFWLKILIGKGFLAILPTRIVQVLLMTVVQTLVIPIVWSGIKEVPFIKNNYQSTITKTKSTS